MKTSALYLFATLLVASTYAAEDSTKEEDPKPKPGPKGEVKPETSEASANSTDVSGLSSDASGVSAYVAVGVVGAAAFANGVF